MPQTYQKFAVPRTLPVLGSHAGRMDGGLYRARRGRAGQVHEAAQRRCACKRIEDGFGALLAEYEDANPDPLQGLAEVVTRTVRMVQTIRARMDELSAGSLDPLVDTPPSNELLCSSTDLQPKSPQASQIGKPFITRQNGLQ
jgi:hypothetical protein